METLVGDVQRSGDKRCTICAGNLGIGEGGEIRFSKEKILEMDYGTGPQHAQLYFNGRIQIRRNV